MAHNGIGMVTAFHLRLCTVGDYQQLVDSMAKINILPCLANLTVTECRLHHYKDVQEFCG